MSEYLPEGDVVLEDDEMERDTLEMPEDKLRVLVAKSVPPGMIVPSHEERISGERAFELATPWAPHR